MAHSVERFSSRVENYVLYRPGYPTEILELLKSEFGLTNSSVVADVGSGTGKLSEVFLQNGNVVIGIEPNVAMRNAAESLLLHQSRFESINGTAEATTLPDSSVDFVVAGQAFHWFDPVATRTEWQRILRPKGWVVLIWNERQVDTTPFLRDYEALLIKYSIDYPVVRHENATERINTFFAPTTPRTACFPNNQVFDFEALKGRLLSSSYTPEPGHPNFESMLECLKEVFKTHEAAGRVAFLYDTRVFFGKIAE
ncbi:MAG TPA: class I SAM-dependent methyltransferase [Pyrinomonadaceae bacterium]